MSVVLVACSPAPSPSPVPAAVATPEPGGVPAPVPARCPPRSFDAGASLGPAFDRDIFVRDESEAIAIEFVGALETLYAEPAADACRHFTGQGLETALAVDPRLRAAVRGESRIVEDHALRVAFEGTYDLRDRPPVVPLDVIFDIAAGATTTDVATGEVITSTGPARVGLHVDFAFDGHRWRADRVGPVTAENQGWTALPTMPPAGLPCNAFDRDPDGAPFDEHASRRWCDGGGRGSTISTDQLALLTRYPCDRGHAAVLSVGRALGLPLDPLDRREYVRDPAGEFLAQHWITAPWNGDAALPADAADTAWTNGNVDLWISPTELERAVYLVRGDVVERWPRAAESWGVTDCN